LSLPDVSGGAAPKLGVVRDRAARRIGETADAPKARPSIAAMARAIEWTTIEAERAMPTETVRTTIRIPAPIYRKLKQQAARQGCSVRDLVTLGIGELLKPQPPKKGRVVFPLIRSKGPKVSLTNQQLYELSGFP
jgi:hypothetical protein